MNVVMVMPEEVQEMRDAAVELRRIDTMMVAMPRTPGNPNMVYNMLQPLAVWIEETVQVLEENPEVTIDAMCALRVARKLKR